VLGLTELVGLGLLELGDLLAGVVRFIGSYVVLSDEQATAVVLWTVHTHAFEAAEATPYLDISSAEKIV
jgi:hypothetical protein